MSTVKDFEQRHDCSVQIFRADRVFGALHLTVATEHAQRSFEHGRNRSEHLGTEILLYCAAERQIKNAIDRLGVSSETEKMVLMIVGDADPNVLLASLGFERDDSVLGGKKDYSAFGITAAEVASVEPARVIDLILEKMAMSELDR